jgi:hypothetical protein
MENIGISGLFLIAGTTLIIMLLPAIFLKSLTFFIYCGFKKISLNKKTVARIIIMSLLSIVVLILLLAVSLVMAGGDANFVFFVLAVTFLFAITFSEATLFSEKNKLFTFSDILFIGLVANSAIFAVLILFYRDF